MSLRKCFPILFLTCWLYGGLNHKMFRDLFRFFGGVWLGSLYCRFCLCPASFNAFSYSGFAASNIFLLLDRLDNRASIALGICFIMEGGWLDCVCTYLFSFPGFLNGLYSFLLRLRVMSRKSSVFAFAVAVIFNPSSLKFAHSRIFYCFCFLWGFIDYGQTVISI